MTIAEREFFIKSGFSVDQVSEIEEGMKAGLNVAIYAKKHFLPIQMRQIRMGMLEKLPVEIYAKQEYDWFQMEEIRKGLRAKLDVSVYASPENSYEIMRELRKGLEVGLNLTVYKRFPAGIMRQIRKSAVGGINVIKYINEGYDAEQIAEISYALQLGVDIEPYLLKEYRAPSIAQISKGIARGIDVCRYAKVCYNWRQMREIRKGLENRVDVGFYESPLYSYEQMREIRLGLEQGLDVDGYRLLRYTAGEMKKKREALLESVRLEEEIAQETQFHSEDFMFEFASGDMEAYITVLVDGKNITRKKFLEILEQSGVRYGIQEEAVEKIVSGRYGSRALLIALGQAPQTGADGWYEYFFRTDMDKRPKVLEDGSVDYQNIEWFETVKAGQKIAYYHSAEEGIDGCSVRGNVLKARKGTEKRILTGKGFKMEEDKKTYIAIKDGMIKLDGNMMEVVDHMELDEINMATGNVSFAGSIHIRGDVTTGTIVKAADDVMVDGNVEGAIIECGGSVILKKGMNAAGNGEIIAEKDVVSKFFESVKVTAKGNIEVDKCLNSQLYAGGKITSSRIIAGGVSHAEQGFRLHHVGNQVGLTTVLKLKVNEKQLEEHKKIINTIREVQQELVLLNRSYEEVKEKFAPEVRNSMDTFIKLEKALFTKSKQLKQLLETKQQMDKDSKRSNEAKVVIEGQAYEGTILEMDGARWKAENQFNITVKRQDNQMEIISN